MKICLLALLILLVSPIFSQTIQITSPQKKMVMRITNSNGLLQYQLHFKGKMVVAPSALAIYLAKPNIALRQFGFIAADSTLQDEQWKPVWGEVSQIRNHYRELVYRTREQSSQVLVTFRFRVFDDGIGFRYEFPEQPGFKHFVVADEGTEFRMIGDHKAFWIPGDYDSNEYLYNTTPLSQIHAVAASQQEKDIAVTSVFNDHGVQTPLMMKSADGLYINIHEAALTNYPAMNLLLDKSSFSFKSHLVPDAVGNAAYLQTPFHTPWRTIIASDRAPDILASKLILNLNEPTALTDVSWIKPQKFMGVWWEMHVGKATWQKEGGMHGATTENTKRYIDFAAKHGFDGVLVEGWNQGWEDWFGNWKEDVFDFITPYSDYDVEELTRYAQEKGVRIIMHHETSGSATNYERWMDAAYDFMVKHNMNTVKTGYVGKIIPRGEHHDGQWMVNHYNRSVQKTAAKKIMMAAHEPVRPTGLHRTYPNLMATEAARGSEFNNAPALGITPEHTTILPFTRLMGGPMDFTPGLFRMELNQFEPQRKQRVRTTLAKQLALYITMYSPLQMAADLPENYEKHLDAFQFIKEVAVDWDDTRILEAEPGDYLTIARKAKGTNDWFVGAITDENRRQTTLPLSFLDAGKKYEATIYRDADQADWEKNPEAYVIEKKNVSAKSNLVLKLATSGGCAIRITPIP